MRGCLDNGRERERKDEEVMIFCESFEGNSIKIKMLNNCNCGL